MAIWGAAGGLLAGFLKGILGFFTAWIDRNKRLEAESKVKVLEAHEASKKEAAATEAEMSEALKKDQEAAKQAASTMSDDDKIKYLKDNL